MAIAGSLLVVLLLLHGAPPAAAQGGAVTLTDPSPDVALCRIDFGVADQVTDDGFYLSMDGDDDDVEARDIRLVAFGGDGPGTLVQDSDTDEIGAAADCQSYSVAYYDVNSNAQYDAGDYVYLGYDKNTSTLVQTTTSSGDWWIRLTPNAYAGGTLVMPGHSDYVSYGAGSVLSGAEFAYHDANGSSNFNSGDYAYITSQAVNTGSALPLHSIRLVHPSYAFGSQTASSDTDMGGSGSSTSSSPTTSTTTPPPTTTTVPPDSVTLRDPEPDAAFCRIDFGVAGQVTDDGFYLSMDGDDDQVETKDIRLVRFGSNGPGTLVQDGDTAERSTSANCQPYTIAYYDANSNARYDGGDYAYAGYNADTASLIQPTSSAGDWWVRLTAAMGYAEGTLLLAGHSDYVTFGSGQAISGSEFAYHDYDNSNSWSVGDYAYFTAVAISDGSLLHVNSVRLVHPYYAFGSQVAAGDNEHQRSPTITTVTTSHGPTTIRDCWRDDHLVPCTDTTTPTTIQAHPVPLTDPVPDVALCRVDFGVVNDVHDDGFYLSIDGDDDRLEVYDIRLVRVGGHPPGTLVTDQDTPERAATAICQPYTVAYYDVNANARFDQGDYVYLGFDLNSNVLVQPTSAQGDWWIRLSNTGSQSPGTLVLAGDNDLVSYGGGQFLPGAEFGFFDRDNSARFTAVDWAYVAAAALEDGATTPLPLHSIRLVHSDYPFGSQVMAGDSDYGPTATTTSSSSSIPGYTAALALLGLFVVLLAWRRP